MEIAEIRNKAKAREALTGEEAAGLEEVLTFTEVDNSMLRAKLKDVMNRLYDCHRRLSAVGEELGIEVGNDG